MLLNEKIKIIIYGNQRKYYESIGYNVPTYIDKKGRIKVKNGTKMVVNVLDLPKGSSLKIKYICDKCGQIFKTSYCKYNNNLKGKLHHSMGFVWRYIDDDFDKFPIKRKDAKTVYQYDLNMNLVKIWDSTMDIQRTLGYRNHYISNCCLGKLSDVYGYIWKYTE